MAAYSMFVPKNLLLIFLMSARYHAAKIHIIDGTEAKPHSHPWLIFMLKNNKPWCGGTLLRSPCSRNGSDLVLSAAHCFYSPHNQPIPNTGINYIVKAGKHDRSKSEIGEEHRVITAGRVHHGFRRESIANDVAILKLSSIIEFSDTIQAIELPTESNHRINNASSCRIAGWGKVINKGGHLTDTSVLHELEVNPDSPFCGKASDFPDDVAICMERIKPGLSSERGTACSGDSGSALVCEQEGRKIQEGVISGSATRKWCGEQGVLVRVSAYLPWIKEQMAELSAC